MKHVAVAGLALSSAFIASALATSVTAPQKIVPPDGPGKTELQGSCLKCHATNVIAAKRKTKDAWNQTITRMQGLGAEVSDDDFDAIATYLAAHYGPLVNVNKATEQQFVESLGIAPEGAAAIVKYRTEHGDFKNLDDLLKVPNVDANKVQSQKDNIAFQDAPASS